MSTQQTDKASTSSEHLDSTIAPGIESNSSNSPDTDGTIEALAHDHAEGQVRRCCSDVDEAASLGVALTEDRFEFTNLHATGGIGRIWLVRERRLNRFVALKELRPELADDAVAAARFDREAKITGQLEHPGVVPIYELGHRPETRQPYYTMRFVKGRTLSAASGEYHQRRRAEEAEPVDLLQLLNAFVAVCNTIAYAHSRGVVHRDLKGANVLLGEFGEVVVADWGLAKLCVVSDQDVDTTLNSGWVEAIPCDGIVPGQAFGTPAHMSPEQAAGRADLVDHRTDVYGLGTILYEILTGHPPFTGSNLQDLLYKVQFEPPQPPSEVCPGIPPELELICLRAIEKSPADRYWSVTELSESIQQWLAELSEEPLKRMAASERQAQTALRKVHDQQRALIELIRNQTFKSPDLVKTFQRLTEVAARTLEVERVGIWRYSSDRSAISCADLYQRSSDRHECGLELKAADYPAYFQALASNEVIAAHDARRDPRTSEFIDGYLNVFKIRSMLDTPTHLFGELDGVLCLEHVGGLRRWTDEEQLFGIALSHLVSLAIEQWEGHAAPVA